MKEEQISLVPEEVIMSRIYMIRGQKVMLDSDLAELYGVETKQLKRAVKRNISRFPHDFMFELTNDELTIGGANLAPPIVRKWGYESNLMHLPNMGY